MSRRELETATGGGRLAALRSLAKSRGIPLSTVVQHADNETLRCVVEHPSVDDKFDVIDKLIALQRKRRLAEIRGDW